MGTKYKRSAPRPTINNPFISNHANSDKNKHLAELKQVYLYLFRHSATMKEVDRATGIMRESICWYLRKLRKRDLLYIVGKRLCKVTKHMAIEWTTDPQKVLKPDANQLKIF